MQINDDVFYNIIVKNFLLEKDLCRLMQVCKRYQNTLPVHIKLLTLESIKNKLHERFGENYTAFKEWFSTKGFWERLGSDFGKALF